MLARLLSLPLPLILLAAALLASITLVVILRPSLLYLLLRPVTWFFLWISWLRVVWSLPIHVRDWLVADTQARQALALNLHATTASSIWRDTGTDFRPIARHILDVVIAPAYQVSLEPNAPKRTFAEQQVLAAAAAVEATGGKPGKGADKGASSGKITELPGHSR